MADVHRITLYYDMVVQYTDCQCQLLGNDFAGQCSNLDMCLNNDHHGMDECKRSLGQKQSLVCQSSFTGYYYTYQFSVNDGNLRRKCHIVCSSHKHPPFILCGTLVWMESKSLFYLAIIPFAALMILLTTFISQSGLRDVQIFFYGGVIVITGTTLLIYIILHLKSNGMTQKHSLTIQAVSIIGGILTAIFFLGFLALARILRSDISCLIVGSILILTTLTISRMVIRSFLDAMNITLYIAGCVLIGFGINASINILFTTLMGISILTFLLSRGFILPFLSVILFNISFFGEAAHVFSSFYPLQIAVVPILALFLFANIFETKLFECIGTKNYFSKYKPFHFGLFISGIVSLGGLSINYLISETNSWLVSCILSVCIWIGILIMVQRIMQVMKVDHPVNQIGIYILCIVICLPTVFAPYLSGSLLLILICFHYGYKAECAASLLLFIYAVSKYYYDLNLSLLTKSMTLFFIGIACITAWYFFTQKEQDMKKYSRILIIANLILLLGYFNWSVYKKSKL